MARAALIVALLASAIAVASAGGLQTAEPTVAPTPDFPETCPTGDGDKDEAQYRAEGGCKRCRSASSPFTQVYGGNTCTPPTTLSERSSVCTNAVHPAFILTNILPRNRIVGCINPFKKTIRVVFPLRNSNYPFLRSSSFIGSSIFLDGTIPRNGNGNGRLVRIGGKTRLYFSFTQPDTIQLRRQAGQTVQITGVWRRDGELLDFCFVSYLQVCG